MSLQPLRDWIDWKPAATLGVALLAMGGSAAAVVVALRPPDAPTADDLAGSVVDEQARPPCRPAGSSHPRAGRLYFGRGRAVAPPP